MNDDWDEVVVWLKDDQGACLLVSMHARHNFIVLTDFI